MKDILEVIAKYECCNCFCEQPRLQGHEASANFLGLSQS